MQRLTYHILLVFVLYIGIINSDLITSNVNNKLCFSLFQFRYIISTLLLDIF